MKKTETTLRNNRKVQTKTMKKEKPHKADLLFKKWRKLHPKGTEADISWSKDVFVVVILKNKI